MYSVNSFVWGTVRKVFGIDKFSLGREVQRASLLLLDSYHDSRLVLCVNTDKVNDSRDVIVPIRVQEVGIRQWTLKTATFPVIVVYLSHALK
jgi:hypothetical protein